MISVIPYVGDAVAKPIMGVSKGSKLMKGVDEALLLAKNGDSVAAGVKLEQLSKSSSMLSKLIDSVPKWAEKLKSAINALPGQKLTGGVRRVLNEWIDLFSSVAKKRSLGRATVGKFADKVAFAPLKGESAVKFVKELKRTLGSDAKVFKNFKASDPSFMSKYFWPGISFSVLGRNRELTSLMRRTKFYAGLLDFLGVGNFVGPEELSKKMNNENLDNKFREYTNTEQGQKYWEEEFGDIGTQPQSQQPTEEPQQQTTTPIDGDLVGSLIKQMLF
jgi:hypothetical protein